MRLLFLSAYYPPPTRGGAELSTSLLAEALVKRGHEVTVITSGGHQEEGTHGGVRVRRLPVMFDSKALLERRAARQVARLVTQVVEPEHYDIIHAQDFRSALITAELGWPNSVVTHRDYAAVCGITNELLADGTPGDCCTWHNLLTNNPRVREVSGLRKLARLWQYKFNLPYRKWAFQQFKRQVFISRAQQEIIARRLDLRGTKTRVIYNPVPKDYLRDPGREGEAGSVLYVGRVEFYKGVGLLLETWRDVAKQFPEAQLTIVGEGAQLEEYKQAGVNFIGRVPWEQLKRIYDDASVVVAPHLWVEPFGRTVAEAMARGKVVVAARAGGAAEMIQNDVTGLLFERGSRESLRQRLDGALNLSESRRQEIGTAARAWVGERLTPEKIAEQYEALYQG